MDPIIKKTSEELKTAVCRLRNINRRIHKDLKDAPAETRREAVSGTANQAAAYAEKLYFALKPGQAPELPCIKAVPFIQALETPKLYQGADARKEMEHEEDMCQGCVNRMHITDDPEEFENLYQSLLRHINRMWHMALHMEGIIRMETFRHQSPPL